MATKKIRDDFEGVTFVYVDGHPIELRAGDEVPKGAKVGDHLLPPKTQPKDTKLGPEQPAGGSGSDSGLAASAGATGAPGDDADPGAPDPDDPTPPDGRSSRDAWLLWAKHVGVDVAEDATKDDIRAAVASAAQQQ